MSSTNKNKSSKKGKNVDSTWEHCSRVGDNRMHVKCNYCGFQGWGGIFRMKHHLAGDHDNVAPCTQCPEDVRQKFVKILQDKQDEFGDEEVQIFGEREKSIMNSFLVKGKGKMENMSKQQTLNSMLKDRDSVVQSICKFFYGHALPFNLVKSQLFDDMMKKVGEFGPGLKLPSYDETKVTFLKKEVDNVKLMMEKYRKEWAKTGCTLMSDGWTDTKQRSITNFLVNSPSGTIFLKSVDTSGIIKDAVNLFELLDSVVEEIGEENVVQVVTDSASAYVVTCEKLMDKRNKLFWSPCAAHCLDLMLHDLGDLLIFMDTVNKAKQISVFIYRHLWVLNLFRKHSQKKELKRAGVTRFATNFLTLESFDDNKIPLRAMFASEEWATSQYASKPEAKKIAGFLLSDDKFWKSITYCLRCTKPIVKVLRMVDGDAKPAMGYIYEAMDRAKEQIAKNFNFKESRYRRIWNIIDDRWGLQLHRPLHAAGYFLNPKFHYSERFNANMEVKIGLYHTIEKMYPDTESKIEIDQQIEKFKKAEGMFGLQIVIATRTTKHSALWWESYGEECKKLQRLAIRVLSLTCSATGCERNWSTFEHIHQKKRNRLEQHRLNALVFVKYNMQLEMRQIKRQQAGESYDSIYLSDMESDDEWITEKESSCLSLDNSWMDVHECFEEIEEFGLRKRKKRGPRNLKYDRKHKCIVREDEVDYGDEDEEKEPEENIAIIEDVEKEKEEEDDDDLDL